MTVYFSITYSKKKKIPLQLEGFFSYNIIAINPPDPSLIILSSVSFNL